MMMTLEKQSDAFIFDFQATYQKKKKIYDFQAD